MVLMLIGNKSDVRHSVTVLTEVGKSFAEKESLYFIETSALRDTNVEKAFTEIVDRMYQTQICRTKAMEVQETTSLSRSKNHFCHNYYCNNRMIWESFVPLTLIDYCRCIYIKWKQRTCTLQTEARIILSFV